MNIMILPATLIATLVVQNFDCCAVIARLMKQDCFLK